MSLIVVWPEVNIKRQEVVVRGDKGQSSVCQHSCHVHRRHSAVSREAFYEANDAILVDSSIIPAGEQYRKDCTTHLFNDQYHYTLPPHEASQIPLANPDIKTGRPIH